MKRLLFLRLDLFVAECSWDLEQRSRRYSTKNLDRTAWELLFFGSTPVPKEGPDRP